jgi:hypothetical protein
MSPLASAPPTPCRAKYGTFDRCPLRGRRKTPRWIGQVSLSLLRNKAGQCSIQSSTWAGCMRASLASLGCSVHYIQCNICLRPSGSDCPRGRSRQDDRKSRERKTRHIQLIHPIPWDSMRNAWVHASTRQPQNQGLDMPRFRMQSRLFRTRTSWRVRSA